MKLGNYLKELRAEESLREAAKRIKISKTYLYLLESGVDPRTNKPIKPAPEVLKSIAKAYKVDYMKLVELAGLRDDAVYTTDINVPFPHNPVLRQWYMNLPNCDENDVEKLMAMWELIKKKDGV